MLYLEDKKPAGGFFAFQAYKCHHLCDYKKITEMPSLEGGQLFIKRHTSEITKT